MGKKRRFDENWSNHESFICTFIRFSCEQVDPSGRMARVIWNSRSKLSRWSVLEIDVMSARTRQDTGLYYAYEHVSRSAFDFPFDREILLERRFLPFRQKFQMCSIDEIIDYFQYEQYEFKNIYVLCFPSSVNILFTLKHFETLRA